MASNANGSNNNTALTWRDFTPADVNDALALSRRLSWPHRREDWQQMASVGNGLALLDEDGSLIGTGFRIEQGNMATIGLIIISDEYQGRGLGRIMMQRLIDGAQASSLVLVATVAGAPLYKKLGFVTCNQVIQFQGVVPKDIASELPSDVQVISAIDHDMLRQMLPTNAVNALAIEEAVDGVVLKQDKRITGIALKRLFGRGMHIGPVVAESKEDALMLIKVLLSRSAGQFVRLDLVDPPSDSCLDEYNLLCVDKVERMCLGKVPAEPELARFGLVTQAFG